MKEYRLKVLYLTGVSGYKNYQIKAKHFKIQGGVYTFRDIADKVVFTSPAKLTVIEHILDLV